MRGGGSRGRPETLGIGIGAEGGAEGSPERTREFEVSWPVGALRPGKDGFFDLGRLFAPGLVAELETLPDRPWARDWGGRESKVVDVVVAEVVVVVVVVVVLVVFVLVEADGVCVEGGWGCCCWLWLWFAAAAAAAAGCDELD